MNFKHLYYFWVTARAGGIMRAGEQLHTTPQTISGQIKLLEDWLASYRPEQLFDERGRLNPDLAELAPTDERRMGANPHANGGLLLRGLRLPGYAGHAVEVPEPGTERISPMRWCLLCITKSMSCCSR